MIFAWYLKAKHTLFSKSDQFLDQTQLKDDKTFMYPDPDT